MQNVGGSAVKIVGGIALLRVVLPLYFAWMLIRALLLLLLLMMMFSTLLLFLCFFFGLIFFVFTTRLYMVSSRLLFLTSGVGFAAIVYYGAGCCRRHVCDDKHTVFFFRFFSVCRHAEHVHTQALTDAHTRTCTDARILHVYLCLCARLRAFQMSSYPRSHKMLQKHLLCGHVQVQVYGLFDIFDDL